MTVKKLSAVLASSVLFTGIGAQADLLADMTARGELTCAVYSDVPPFSSPDANTRQLVGMDVDLCNALAKQMGLKLALVPTSVEARIAVIVIRTEEGWLYLATVIDLYSRRIIGWSLSNRLKTQVVIDALEMAIKQRKPTGPVLAHSDRGSQYASHRYRDVLKDNGLRCSMSGKGCCYDNAVMESFYHTLKTELMRGKAFVSREQAMNAIFDYIEVFYNRRRKHSTLGYQTPVDYEVAA
ncbi:IS3 family transposase [Dickeya chrysanthemi]|uniref:IS3 family transposase n=1 Tax=Dickeya chrysanthemi TaxID=556 RepID=A0ABU8JP57_DICCH